MITPVARASAGIPAPSKSLLLALALALITAACGNRGPLYLPDEPPPPAVSAEADPDSGEAAPGAREAEEETQDDVFGHEGDEED